LLKKSKKPLRKLSQKQERLLKERLQKKENKLAKFRPLIKSRGGIDLRGIIR